MISRRSVKYYRSGIIAAWLAAVALTVSLAGCSAVTEPERPCPDDPGADAPTLGLSFQVSTAVPVSRSHAASRTDDSGHPEEGSDYTIEDEINLNDFGFFIFAGAGADARLLYKNTAVSQESSELELIGGLGYYTVNLDLPHTLVEELLGVADGDGSPLSPGGSRNLRVRIAIVANTSASRQTQGLPEGLTGLQQAYGYDNAAGAATFKDFTDAVKDIVYAPPAGDYDNLLIPMYGLSDEITLTESAMYWSRPDDRLMLGEVFMLRAMAKLRLMDRIENKTGGYPCIENASVSYSTGRGYVTPVDPATYVNGRQVHTDRIVTSDGATAAMRQGRKEAASLISYLPAQQLGSGAPRISVDVKRTAGAETETYEIDLSDPQYTVIGSDWGGIMLRNHVYRLAVVSVSKDKIRIIVRLTPWSVEDVDVDYN